MEIPKGFAPRTAAFAGAAAAATVSPLAAAAPYAALSRGLESAAESTGEIAIMQAQKARDVKRLAAEAAIGTAVAQSTAQLNDETVNAEITDDHLKQWRNRINAVAATLPVDTLYRKSLETAVSAHSDTLIEQARKHNLALVQRDAQIALDDSLGDALARQDYDTADLVAQHTRDSGLYSPEQIQTQQTLIDTGRAAQNVQQVYAAAQYDALKSGQPPELANAAATTAAAEAIQAEQDPVKRNAMATELSRLESLDKQRLELRKQTQEADNLENNALFAADVMRGNQTTADIERKYANGDFGPPRSDIALRARSQYLTAAAAYDAAHEQRQRARDLLYGPGTRPNGSRAAPAAAPLPPPELAPAPAQPTAPQIDRTDKRLRTALDAEIRGETDPARREILENRALTLGMVPQTIVGALATGIESHDAQLVVDAAARFEAIDRLHPGLPIRGLDAQHVAALKAADGWHDDGLTDDVIAARVQETYFAPAAVARRQERLNDFDKEVLPKSTRYAKSALDVAGVVYDIMPNNPWPGAGLLHSDKIEPFDAKTVSVPSVDKVTGLALKAGSGALGGAAAGSIIPGVGTAVGALIGAVGTPVASAVIESTYDSVKHQTFPWAYAFEAPMSLFATEFLDRQRDYYTAGASAQSSADFAMKDMAGEGKPWQPTQINNVLQLLPYSAAWNDDDPGARAAVVAQFKREKAVYLDGSPIENFDPAKVTLHPTLLTKDPLPGDPSKPQFQVGHNWEVRYDWKRLRHADATPVLINNPATLMGRAFDAARVEASRASIVAPINAGERKVH